VVDQASIHYRKTPESKPLEARIQPFIIIIDQILLSQLDGFLYRSEQLHAQDTIFEAAVERRYNGHSRGDPGGMHAVQERLLMHHSYRALVVNQGSLFIHK
jgi:hypothetical protein